MQKVDGKDIAWLLRCKECSKTLKIKDVKETITGDFKMCDKHLEMIEKIFKNNKERKCKLKIIVKKRWIYRFFSIFNIENMI